MKTIWNLCLLGLVALLVGGCSTNYYNIPRETYEQKVRVLGVLPLLTDGESDIRHPEKGELLKLVKAANRKNEKELVDMLRESGDYFSVRLLDEDPEQLLSSLVMRRERRDDAGVVYNKYFYKPEELKRLVTKHNVDGILVMTISGITLMEKVFANNFFSYLEENYNNLVLTAQILDGDGSLLWEYPNFRQKVTTYGPFLALQYPDFEEAKANMIDQVQIKFKSLSGLGRALTRTEKSTLSRSREVAAVYNRQFDVMAALLHHFRNPFAGKKEDQRPAVVPEVAPAAVPAAAPAAAPAPVTAAAPEVVHVVAPAVVTELAVTPAVTPAVAPAVAPVVAPAGGPAVVPVALEVAAPVAAAAAAAAAAPAVVTETPLQK